MRAADIHLRDPTFVIIVPIVILVPNSAYSADNILLIVSLDSIVFV